MSKASSQVTGMASSTSRTGMTAVPETPSELANKVQDSRPASSPSGSPATVAAAASAVASQQTTPNSCGRSRPRAFRMASSRRRRRTLVTSTWANVPTASTASTSARTSGVSRTPA